MYIYIARVAAVWPTLILRGVAGTKTGSKFNPFNSCMCIRVNKRICYANHGMGHGLMTQLRW